MLCVNYSVDGCKITNSCDYWCYSHIIYRTHFLSGRAARELISSNGKDIVYEIGPPVIKAMVREITSSVQNLFDNIPTENLTLDV